MKAAFGCRLLYTAFIFRCSIVSTLDFGMQMISRLNNRPVFFGIVHRVQSADGMENVEVSIADFGARGIFARETMF